jgi:hypothetical protein
VYDIRCQYPQKLNLVVMDDCAGDDPRPQNGTGGRCFLARMPILLPDNLRVDVPVDGTGTSLLLRQYCADNPLSAPSADLALDPNSSSIFSRGACFRVFCRLYPSHPSAQSASSSIGQQNGCGGGGGGGGTGAGTGAGIGAGAGARCLPLPLLASRTDVVAVYLHTTSITGINTNWTQGHWKTKTF